MAALEEEGTEEKGVGLIRGMKRREEGGGEMIIRRSNNSKIYGYRVVNILKRDSLHLPDISLLIARKENVSR